MIATTGYGDDRREILPISVCSLAARVRLEQLANRVFVNARR